MDDDRQQIEKIVERFKVSPEYVELVLNAKQSTTVRKKLDIFNKEKSLIKHGDSKAIKAQHEKGRLTARERINILLDPGSFEELDLWHMPYETDFDTGEALGMGDGVVIGYGLANNRPVSLWSQDATVIGGTMGTVHARKVNMIMENALNARTPIVGIFDSEGLRAHDLMEYPEFYSTSGMAKFQTMASGVIPKISLIMGPCTEEQSIIAAMGDFLFMVKKTSYMHLMPESAEIDSQEIGDPSNVHARLTGCCDVLAEDEEDCLRLCRELLEFLPPSNMERSPVVDTGDDPERREEDLLELVPTNSKKPFNMHKLISLVVDNGRFFEIKRHFATNLITGFARLDGHSVGIIANNPRMMGGCMTLDAADKMSRFVRFCNAFNIPCIWLSDTPAFLPAVQEERRGLIRHGSRMIM
ncbi:MAG: carboxyl transferase domain-containing protein, partial [Thermodesulfobacteriota bacterium]|nr:carboxyl transferase domain-containing protein [Thermodesulfobacteriota bacterium]